MQLSGPMLRCSAFVFLCALLVVSCAEEATLGPPAPAPILDSDGDGVLDPDDAFPRDAACQLPEHAIPERPSTCDAQHWLPAYEPVDVATGDDGVVYLLDAAGQAIHRWSAVDEDHLPSFEIGAGAVSIVLADALDRLYVVFASGEIEYLDLLQPEPTPTAFLSLGESPTGVAAAGAYLYVIVASGHPDLHRTFDSSGAQVGSIAGGTNRGAPWHVNGQVFFVEYSSTSFSALGMATVAPGTGMIEGVKSTANEDKYRSLRAPLRSSPDGRRVLFASGHLYDSRDATWLDARPDTHADALWRQNGELVVLESTYDDTILRRYGAGLEPYDDERFSGSPIGVLELAGRVVVITQLAPRPAFWPIDLDDDLDEDTIANPDDAFPLDPAASIDTDGDGHPDEWHPEMGPEDSTTGLLLDAFPVDRTCHLEEHGRDDAPELCDYATAMPDFVPNEVVADIRGVVHLLSLEHDSIYRWSTSEDRYLSAIPLRARSTSLAYAAVNDRLYVGYGSGDIDRIDPTAASADAQAFATRAGSVLSLAAAGSHVMSIATDDPDMHVTHLADGATASAVESEYSGSLEFSPATDRMYFFSDDARTNGLHSEPVDPSTGEIGAFAASPQRGDYPTAAPIRISPDGARVLIGSGDLFDSVSLERVDSLPIAPADMLWLPDGSAVTIRTVAWTQTRLEHWGPDLLLRDVAHFDAKPLRIASTGDGIVVVLDDEGRPRFEGFLADGDSDGDGAPYVRDAFPLDPAASIDTDGDGAPDGWNAGSGPDDSTQGLALDAFPDDSACQTPAHALPTDPTRCDIVGSTTSWLSRSFVVDADGIMYDLHASEGRIARWDPSTGLPLNPIIVPEYPSHLAYSQADESLYLGHRTGAITKVDLESQPLRATPFATLPGRVDNLQVAGEWVFASDPSGWENSYYTFSLDGLLVSNEEGYAATEANTWSPANSRVYRLSASNAPRSLTYVDVDPATGAISDSVGAPYRSETNLGHRVRISQDGAFVLLGSGRIYDGSTLEHIATLPSSNSDALWLPDGSLLTLHTEYRAEWTRLEHRRPDLTLYNVEVFDGAPTRVVMAGGDIVVVTWDPVGDQSRLDVYVPTNDGDGDGFAYDEDAFPLDPSASLDDDQDGAPDAWNSGAGPADSTSGLTLDSFPGHNACQLPEHAVPGMPDACDTQRMVPVYTPADAAVDAAGMIHLLAPEHGRIFRWSSATGEHVDPLVVDDSALHLVHSEPLDRLYVGHDDGRITMFDLDVPRPTEAPFAHLLYGRIHGLAPVGDLLFAISEQRTTPWHHTFDAAGTQLASAWSYYEGFEIEYVPSHERVYYLRSTAFPTTLEFEEVDPITGELGAEETIGRPPRVATTPPLRPSPDGARLLFGSGALYAGGEPRFEQNLATAIEDAVWLDEGELLTIRSFDGGITLLEQHDVDLRRQTWQAFGGEPLRIFEAADAHVVVTSIEGRPAFALYEPSDDGDGDGVIDSLDDLPLDPSASLDTDHDGHPDEWNPGRGPEDSTQGLALDAFPYDLACHLEEHGVDGVCDFVGVLPESIDAPFCETDVVPEQPPSGSVSFTSLGGFLPLCDGWVFVSDAERDRVVLMNLIAGREGSSYSLRSSPGVLELDEQRKRLFVGLPDAGAVAVIDLVTAAVEVVLGVGQVRSIALGADGELFIASILNPLAPSGSNLWRLPSDSLVAEGPWELSGAMIDYNAALDEVIATNAWLNRYAFDPVDGLELIQRTAVGEYLDLAVSDDGEHVAVASRYGNGGGATIRDLAGSNLLTILGEWDVGHEPTAVAFSRSSSQVVATNRSDVIVFDVSSHHELGRLSAPACDVAGGVEDVAFSRGGEIAFGKHVCIGGAASSSIHWFLP